jgi:DNA-binding LytR/AlgR family response regulator
MENNKLIAITEKGNFQIKERLYRIEEIVYDGFIKINQSTLVKRIDIERFEVSVGGALMVVLKNGYKDYVSRRQLKKVKERLGL